MKLKSLALIPLLFASHTYAKTYFDCDSKLAHTNEKFALACNVYHEARGEPDKGRLGVAFVTLNRVIDTKYFPNLNSVPDVVWFKAKSRITHKWVAHFSWTLDGKSDKIHDLKSWNECLEVATYALDIYNKHSRLYDYADVTHGSLWYHRKDITPIWSNTSAIALSVGHHFYFTDINHI